MTAINKTVPTTKRTLSVQLEDDALEKRIHMIPAAISRYWNALPLKLDITDATCGRDSAPLRGVAGSDRHRDIRCRPA